jgi:hypothetical protein
VFLGCSCQEENPSEKENRKKIISHSKIKNGKKKKKIHLLLLFEKTFIPFLLLSFLFFSLLELLVSFFFLDLFSFLMFFPQRESSES